MNVLMLNGLGDVQTGQDTKGRETGSNTTGGARDAWEPPMIPTND